MGPTVHSGSLSGAMRRASVRVIFSGLVGWDHVNAQNHNTARLHRMSDVRNISFRKFCASLRVEKKLQDTKSRRQACETYGKQACNAGLAGM